MDVTLAPWGSRWDDQNYVEGTSRKTAAIARP